MDLHILTVNFVKIKLKLFFFKFIIQSGEPTSIVYQKPVDLKKIMNRTNILIVKYYCLGNEIWKMIFVIVMPLFYYFYRRSINKILFSEGNRMGGGAWVCI